MSKIKTLFRISDIFLLLGLVFGVAILFEGNRLMSTPNPLETHFPFFVYVLAFVVFIASFCLYLFFEKKKDNFVIFPAYSVIFILFAILGAESIFLNGNDITTLIHSKVGLNEVITHINNQVKTIYYFNYVILLCALYVGLFILPKRIKSVVFIKIFCYVFYAVALGLIIHSIIVDDYITLFQKLFGTVEEFKHISGYAPKGIFGNKNFFGMFLELGLVITFINYSIGKKKFHIFIAAIFYVLIVLSICKTAIVVVSLLVPLYFIVYLIVSIINKNKDDITISSICIGLIIISALISLIFYLNNIEFQEKVNFAIGDTGTMESRFVIWRQSFDITLGNDALLRGTGYGVYNSILLNSARTWASHNFFMSILGRGGIIALTGYFGILIYIFVTFLKMFKLNKVIAISTALATSSFFIHSFSEDNYYMVLVLFVIMLTVYYGLDNNPKLVNKLNGVKQAN